MPGQENLKISEPSINNEVHTQQLEHRAQQLKQMAEKHGEQNNRWYMNGKPNGPTERIRERVISRWALALATKEAELGKTHDKWTKDELAQWKKEEDEKEKRRDGQS